MKNGLEIDEFGNKRYYLNSRFHRKDGPAIDYTNGNKWWYLNGEPHRKDGPAVEWANGKKYWYYYGRPMECKTQEEFEQLMRLKAFW